jgi:hypothetical protein
LDALELKVPPVALALIVAAAMWLASTYTPSLVLAIPWRSASAAGLVGVGTAFALAGVVAFRKAKTTLNPIAAKITS